MQAGPDINTHSCFLHSVVCTLESIESEFQPTLLVIPGSTRSQMSNQRSRTLGGSFGSAIQLPISFRNTVFLQQKDQLHCKMRFVKPVKITPIKPACCLQHQG